MRVKDLAVVVRREAEQWARDEGYDDSLLMQCAVVSEAFLSVAKDLCIDCTLAAGWFCGVNPPDPHFWAFAFDERVLLVDLTATQYEIDGVPPVCVLAADDPALVNYKLQCADREAYTMVAIGDIIESLELAARVRARLQAAGKMAPRAECAAMGGGG